jgi:predicted protein tyrosine phosphatase
MKILVLCSYGQNRSRYLAGYLSTKGHETEFDGVKNEDKGAVQEKIAWSDAVIAVTREIREKAQADFDLTGKKVFALDVDDRPQKIFLSLPILTGDEWVEFQEQHVYPKLIEQANQILNLDLNRK